MRLMRSNLKGHTFYCEAQEAVEGRGLTGRSFPGQWLCSERPGEAGLQEWSRGFHQHTSEEMEEETEFSLQLFLEMVV